jgi:hypothetical protein
MEHLSAELPALLSYQQVALALGFSTNTIRKWLYGQNLAPIGFPEALRIAGSRRYKKADINAWLDSVGRQHQQPTETTNKTSPEVRRGPGRPRKAGQAALLPRQ